MKMRAPAIVILVVLTLVPASRSQPSEAGTSPPPPIEKLSDVEYRLGEIRFNRRTRAITFPAKVNLQHLDNLIEYAIVHEHGKTHESLLSTPISPQHLQIVLLLLGYKAAPGTLFEGGQIPPEDAGEGGPRLESDPSGVVISLRWDSGGKGGGKEARIEDWILDRAAGTPMTRGAWVFNGSAIEEGQFQAELEGSIVAIYLDALALLNNPRERNDDDENWSPLMDKVPPLETPVEVSFRPLPPTPKPSPGTKGN